MKKFFRKCCVSFLTRTCRIWPDKLYLGLLCRVRLGYKINWNNPKTFSEKLQWMKVNYCNPLYTCLVDKYRVKEYVADKLGIDYVIPNIGVWDSFNDIDFSALPEMFAMKCTHDSGGIVLCKNKANLDIAKAKKKLNKSLNYDFYYLGREWPYRNVDRKIIAEELLVSDDGEDLKDYKFFCFDGEVKCFKIELDRFSDHRADYYDKECTLLNFGEAYYPPEPNRHICFPDNIKEMISAAETLSKDIPFVRVDFYNVNGRIYFGEMTFFPAGGTCPYTSYEADLLLGSWLKLPELK